MPPTLHSIAIFVTDIDRAKRFYRDDLELLTQALLDNEELDREAVDTLLKTKKLPEPKLPPPPVTLEPLPVPTVEPAKPKLAFGGA